MSLESFIGTDSGEPMSEGALEQLRERMRAAAAQIAAIKKEEKKQKKKEYDLLKILLHFIKTSNKSNLTLLISRVLEINVPANFILAIIILGNEEIQKQAGNFLMLNLPEDGSLEHAPSDKTLTFFSENDESLPLRIKIELDNWIKDMLSEAEEVPEKIIKSGYKIEIIEIEKEYDFEDQKYEEKKYIQPPLVNLCAYVMRDFLEQNKTSEPYQKIHDFAEFILKGILNKSQESIDKRLLLN